MQKKFQENLLALPTITIRVIGNFILLCPQLQLLVILYFFLPTIAVIGNSILPSFRKPLTSTSKPAVWRSLYYYYDSYYCRGGGGVILILSSSIHSVVTVMLTMLEKRQQ